MKNLFLFLPAFTSALIVSCGSNHAAQSFEISPSGDTINRVDPKGLRQGLWLMPISKDTMIMLNDTGYSTDRTTSGEIMRLLKRGGNNGVIPLEKVNDQYVAPSPDSVKVGS